MLAQDASIVDLVSEQYPDFDHRGIIVEPFDNESKRDTEFQNRK
jgi:hypothetical protein